MEVSKRNQWRALITGLDGKIRKVKLLGGVGSDELVAFCVELKAGEMVLLESANRNLGFDGIYHDQSNCEEKEGKILIGKDGTYDLRLSTKKLGAETLDILESAAESAELSATQKKNLGKIRAKKVREIILTILHNLFIALLVLIWLIPIIWLILVSFTGNLSGPSMSKFFPDVWSFENYVTLFTKIDAVNKFPTWLLNTFIIAVCSTILSTLMILATAYAFSRFQFKKRRKLMNLSMVIALFPGMLTMFVSYFIFQEVFKLNSGIVRLIIAYSAGAALGYLVTKGFFDTIPIEIDEAAKIDGASRARIFFQILVPLSKPIIVYTIITSFMAPWVDFVFANIILGNDANVENYTVALGLLFFVGQTNLTTYFGAYAAGSVIIAIPLSVLFISVQKYYVGGVTGGAVKG